MVNSNFATDGVIGTNIIQADTVAQFELGQRISGNEGAVYVYCQAAGAITGDGYVILIDEAFQADMIDLTNSATAFGQAVGVGKAALADNEFGWIQISGTANIRVAASAAANAQLNSTAVAGELDDDATAGSEDAERIVLQTANGGSAAIVEGVLNFPTVGATNV